MISWWLVSYFTVLPLCRHLDQNEIIQVPNNVFKNLARLEFLWVYKFLVYKYIVRAIQQIYTSVLTDVGSVTFVSAYVLLMPSMHFTSYLTSDESDEIWSFITVPVDKTLITWWLVSLTSVLFLHRKLSVNKISQLRHNVFTDLTSLTQLWAYPLFTIADDFLRCSSIR